VSFVDRHFLAWALGGLVVAFALGWAIGGSVYAGLTGLLWGGAVRILVVHHVTYSINSLCHFFGRRRFDTGDESRNLFWLAPFSFGESWHNNHHAFPTSAMHGMRAWEIDPAALVIRALEKLGLVWDVVRVDAERQARKAIS
jgi:fatty-acid desaturase